MHPLRGLTAAAKPASVLTTAAQRRVHLASSPVRTKHRLSV